MAECNCLLSSWLRKRPPGSNPGLSAIDTNSNPWGRLFGPLGSFVDASVFFRQRAFAFGFEGTVGLGKSYSPFQSMKNLFKGNEGVSRRQPTIFFVGWMVCCASFMFLNVTARAEEIILKNGHRFTGRILEENAYELKIDRGRGVIRIDKKHIERIVKDPLKAEKNLESKASRPSSKVETQAPAVESQAPVLKFKQDAQSVFQRVSDAVVVLFAISPNGSSQGSGVLLSDGIVLTNFHVVAGAQDITVKNKNSEKYDVLGVVFYDLGEDICILKTNANNSRIAQLGDSNKVTAGDKVFVIGAPLGLEYSITDGLISAIRSDLGQKIIQFSAPISPGNSGGPLLDESGEVIGITTSTVIDGQNINLGIPINSVKKYITTNVKISRRNWSNL